MPPVSLLLAQGGRFAGRGRVAGAAGQSSWSELVSQLAICTCRRISLAPTDSFATWLHRLVEGMDERLALRGDRKQDRAESVNRFVVRHPLSSRISAPFESAHMHQGSCHCGAVKLTLPSTPVVATACNCSLCRRVGGPWAYFEFGTVEIEGHPENTAEYIQGDRTLKTIRCRTCGCVTHWEPLDLKPGVRHGVHLGSFDPELLASVKVREFDGANTWKFFDELPAGDGLQSQDHA